ncbi:uncharacterized protein KY384_001004 [Bacidia gigantensis]|uniref:uncharacterized protein n=1 Tax=Bacidia gigantensis TaxID=2732470 RepID=UPI001D03E67D|nr:uncharacterized protein KY384_001004 [Bacidia gigantensis]KAG8534160.1 hypothetical protein KY384_001004 [Bacidia gigantensis]
MAGTPKGSIHNHLASVPAPVAKAGDNNDTYRMMVLRFEEPEEDVDRHYIQRALELGINLPEESKTSLELVGKDVAALDIASAAPVPVIPTPIDARKSRSINAPSDSSVDSKGHRKTPSLAATSSITSTSAPSSASAVSNKSNYVKFKRGIKRFSTIRSKRKSLATQSQPSAPELPLRPPPATRSLRPEISPRSNTADYVPTLSRIQSHTVASPPLSPTGRPTGRRKVISMPLEAAPPPPMLLPTHSPPPPPASSPAPPPPKSPRRPERPLTPPRERAPSPSAFARSLVHPTLKKLRTTQLQEQLRFISFRASQTRLMRTRHLSQKRDRLSTYKLAQTSLESRHAEALADLEHRQLSAEADLEKTLENERQACDTRLKHMQAYCNPQENIERGLPVRQVTKDDYRMLEQQYHVRSGMENLHAGRINVLREKQAKQVDRVVDKQEKEVGKLGEEFESENEEVDKDCAEEERRLEQEFVERRQRLVGRWRMTEAIERRTLELENGQLFAPLPEIGWGDDTRDGEEAEGEIRRLMREKRMSVDPESGVLMEEDLEVPPLDTKGEDATSGARWEFDEANVI